MGDGELGRMRAVAELRSLAVPYCFAGAGHSLYSRNGYLPKIWASYSLGTPLKGVYAKY